ILDNVTFHIMPMVNPDGVNIVQNGFGASLNQSNLVNMIKNDGAATYGSAAWKANSRGVDLNRNFSSGWYNKIVNEFKTTAPASSRFGGYSPESEIETQTMVAYLNTINPQAVLSFHTQGQIVYASTKGEAERKIARNISIESGFPVNTNNNPHGTFQDYIDEKYNVFYACIELCKYVGPYPYPNENFDKVWSPVRNACLITAKGVMEMGN
ncbi:MAG: M14 family zinc carboxypeptidase, partial [Anaerotignaceae bacterium]